jgi:hypothetical protein
VDIRAEWATGTASEGYLTEDLTQTGFYGQASYTMPLEGNNMKSIGFAARFGWSDPNTDFNDDEFTQIALGMNFSPTDHFNFKLEFDMNQDSLPEDADDNAILAQGVLGW